ncbi:hypothetical protein VTH06DRAFT_8562 [Thermothelomyces fergusii]
MPHEQRRGHRSSTTRQPNRTLCDRNEVCQRIASHWDKATRKRTKQLILDWPWDEKHFEDNDIVLDVKIRILTGGCDLEGIVPATIAVMAWTKGEFPESWHHALAHLPGRRSCGMFLSLPKTREQRLMASLRRKADMFSHMMRASNPELPVFPDSRRHPWPDMGPIEQQDPSDDADEEWSERDDAAETNEQAARSKKQKDTLPREEMSAATTRILNMPERTLKLVKALLL